MKLTIEPTRDLVPIAATGISYARLWRARGADGAPIDVLVAGISAPANAAIIAELETELSEVKPSTIPPVAAPASPASETINRDRVEALAGALLRAVAPELRREPPSRDNALVVLNALAFALVPVLMGTQGDRTGFEFFRRALRDNLREFAVAKGIAMSLPAWIAGEAAQDRC